jgi:tight adherence protein B
MPGMSAAGVLLAAALLVSPRSPRHRPPNSTPRPRRHLAVTFAAVLTLAGAALSLSPALLPVGVIGGSVVLGWRRRRASERRSRTEGRAMAAALEVLIGELRIGAHPVRAFTVAAGESPPVVGLALQRVAARARLGADVAAGLLAAAENSAVPAYWRRLAICWELAAQRGLAMSVLMRAAHQDIVERQRFTDRMRSALAGARATAVILAGLPGLGVVLGQSIGANPVRFLLGGGVGGVVLVVGVALIAAGLAWSDRITERLLS